MLTPNTSIIEMLFEHPHSSNLMVTAGATQALHMMATVLFGRDTVVFMEDPTYFAAAGMLSQDLQMQVVSGKDSY